MSDLGNEGHRVPLAGISGIRLNCFGTTISVEVELDGRWFKVISEYYDGGGHLSHIVEPAGVLEAAAQRASYD